MASSTASRFSHMIGVQTRLDDENEDSLYSPENISRARHDWRFAVEQAIVAGDFQALKEAGIVPAQLTMLQLANDETASDNVRYNAASFILSQNAHGPIAKAETTIDLKKLPRDQLMAVIQSKLALIQKHDPNFDPVKLLPVSNVQNVSRETNDDDNLQEDEDQIIEAEFEGFDE